MKCEDCKYHSYVDGTHFCDSMNYKRRIVRISDEEAKKDIDCKWLIESGDAVMEWITDRPPDKNGKYLVTGRQGGISILSYTDGSWCRKWAVMAWMLLPEPYKEVDAE